MSEPFSDQDEATVWGTVFKTDERVSRDGNTFIFTASFSDKTSSQVLKIITPSENTDVVKDNVAVGKAIIVSGKFEYDNFAKEINMRPYSIATIKTHSRKDLSDEKRVELHMHTTMSDICPDVLRDYSFKIPPHKITFESTGHITGCRERDT